jgi:hypothetical protein
MSTEPEPKKSNKTLLIVSIVAGVVLVIVLVCGGVGYFAIQAISKVASSAMEMVQDVQSGRVAGEDFLSDVANDRLEAAYGRMTAAYQKGRSLDEFRKLIDQSPVLKTHTSRTQSGITVTPPKVVIQATLNRPTGASACTLQVIKEGEQWKVDQFTVP